MGADVGEVDERHDGAVWGALVSRFEVQKMRRSADEALALRCRCR